MKRLPSALAALSLLVAVPLAAQARGGSRAAPAQRTTAQEFEAASLAWEKGDYLHAIDLLRLVLSTEKDTPWVDSVALLTGELYRSRELTADGTRPVFSPDGKRVAWEDRDVRGTPRRFRTLSLGTQDHGKAEQVFAGYGPVFAPSGILMAYFAAPSEGGTETMMINDVVGGPGAAVRGLEGWTPSSFTFGVNDDLYIVAAKTGDSGRNDILRAQRDGNTGPYVVRATLPSGDGFKGTVVAVPGGRYLVHTVAQGNPARLATGMAGLRAANAFGVIDLNAMSARRVTGRAASFSANGATLVYLTGTNTDGQVVVEPMAGGTPVVVKKATTALANPAISPDGRTVVFGNTPVYDAELYLVNSDGTGERRLTREIQHDLLPVFLDNNRLVAVMGEARHRRSYLYDLTTLQRTRLFHNNTIRTIAPEYDWTVSADGSKVLIGAERDGNTVTLDRGVYLMDLAAKVSAADLESRLTAMKAAEQSLRLRGLAAFRPIAAQVKGVTEQVDVGRIYRYEKGLFDLDSKHITQPGNARAIAWLMNQYALFGYQPQEQSFSPPNALGGKTANVLAVLKGTENPDLVYVVSSHFDSRAEGPGADDNTSGTAALLEAARVLSRHPMPATIIFASFTGEEAGLLGSREFVRQAVADKMKLVGALNNDMLGWANDQRLDNTIRYSNPGIRDIQHAAAMQFSSMITFDALYYKSTDANAYYDAYGDIVGGIGSYPVLGNPHYHMPHDVLEVENHQLIAEASRTTVATLMLLASSPSRLTDLTLAARTGRQAQLTWTASPEKGVTQYLAVALDADGTERRLGTSTLPRITLPDVAPGTVVGIKAINAKGLAGWDWARIMVP